MRARLLAIAPALLLSACGNDAVDPTAGGATSTSTGMSTTTGAVVTLTTSLVTEPGGSSGDEGTCLNDQTRSCYGGPAGTEGVGLCRAGVETCDWFGRWGPCVGEVTPQQQDCATPEDESCSEVAPCSGGLAWSRRFPYPDGAIRASALAVAGNGEVVATGTFRGDVMFGGVLRHAAGEGDIWIARFDPEGAVLWFRSFGAPGPAEYPGLATSDGNIRLAPDGDILFTSRCVGDVDFGQGPLAGEEHDAVVLRMTAAGEVEWARRAAGMAESHDGGENTLWVAPGPDGRAWLAATIRGSVDVGGGPLKSAGWGDVLLAQLDVDGTVLWNHRHGDPGHQTVRAIDATPDGGLVIAGGLEGALDFGDGPLLSAGTSDAYVVRFDAEGAPLWARTYGDNFMQSADDVRVDEAGEIVVAGHFESAIDLGGGPLKTAKVEHDPYPGHFWWTGIFVARLDGGGEHRWSTALLRETESVGFSTLDVGADGTIVLAGGGEERPQFAGDVWGQHDGPWLAALAGDGSQRWLHGLFNSATGQSILAGAGPTGAAIAAFEIYGEVYLDGAPFGEPDVGQLVLAQFGP
ncbi:hypothetical protein [Nannocystis punicea]|uniref:Uncharacterized protein n=1 Tax=Nannocystis punicea TaxID=2995304 RepID=A0ABY7H0X9_9BACT|nr:hypothetical protein [Nannocystis poenicansa]WAS92780.1 hypothetical protein O0S08_41930 [Nannocystis poenicansa]